MWTGAQYLFNLMGFKRTMLHMDNMFLKKWPLPAKIKWSSSSSNLYRYGNASCRRLAIDKENKGHFQNWKPFNSR
jgi:hypothetical protein